MPSGNNKDIAQTLPASPRSNFITKAGRITEATATYFNYIGAIVLIMVMLVIFANVLMRKLASWFPSYFNPIPGAVEIVNVMLVVLVFLGVAYVQVQKRHVAVEFFTEKLSAKAQNILTRIVFFACAIFCALMAWQSSLQAIKIKSVNQVSSTLRIPYWPFYWVLAAGAALLCVVLLIDVIRPSKRTGKGGIED